MIKGMKKKLNIGDIVLLYVQDNKDFKNPLQERGNVVGYVRELKEDCLILDSYNPRGYKPSHDTRKGFSIQYSAIKSYEKVS